MQGNKAFYITEDDKEWVHQSFEWLLKSYGYPSPDAAPVLFTNEFFPATLAHKQTAIPPLLEDLCYLLKIDPGIISFEIEEDIRDAHGTPYEIHGAPFECDLELIPAGTGYHYKLYFARSLLKTPKRLVFNAVFQFIQIDLSKTDIEWVGSEDHHFLFYLIGMYKGWGVILAQTMIDTGKEMDGIWERTWRYVSPMPLPVMAYGMALFSGMIEEKNPAWKSFLPPDIRIQYEKAVEFLSKQTNPFFNKQELTAHRLFKEADRQSLELNFGKAIEIYRKAIFLTKDKPMRCLIYNNIGYMYLLQADYRGSIVNFQKALEINPGFAYANDNLGFAFIMTGELETAMHYLTIALQTPGNEPSYSYRNLALYYQKKGQAEKARENFQKAFETVTFPVDWLEYLYARFLSEQGEKEEALVYLQMAVDKGELRAIEWMSELKGAG